MPLTREFWVWLTFNQQIHKKVEKRFGTFLIAKGIMLVLQEKATRIYNHNYLFYRSFSCPTCHKAWPSVPK
jgi:hypothetical protein